MRVNNKKHLEETKRGQSFGSLMFELWRTTVESEEISKLGCLALYEEGVTLESDKKLIIDWFLKWPPDIFLLTSVILKNTGTYIHTITPPPGIKDACWPDSHEPISLEDNEISSDRSSEGEKVGMWKERVAQIARDWKLGIVGQKKIDEVLYHKISTLCSCWDIEITTLYNCKEDAVGAKILSWELCKTILDLHVFADEAFRGIGILSTDGNMSNEIPNGHLVKLLHYQADLLLTVRGTLSRFPKHYGIILPKARTPQFGTTIRSFSFNLTYHSTEVDVLWRTLPWNNLDEQTINVMVIPWPREIFPTDFSSVPHPQNRIQLGNDRFFKFKRSKELDERVYLDIIKQIKHAQKTEVKRVHMLVFPEASITYYEVKKLQWLLTACMDSGDVPMIIAGVAGENAEKKAKESINDDLPYREYDDDSDAPYNNVTMSVFFANYWYDIIQSKHHRWFLDNNQIRMYGLAGILTGSKFWWEHINIRRRSISFLSAAPWFTLCTLICEDLARLEPVSDVIRGVGPNLLIALLLDGPQLKERWPGRYASVLADDPGSSVLTVTALGMANRAKKKRDQNDQTQDDVAKNAKTVSVSLWKDMLTGFQQIEASGSRYMPILKLNAFWEDDYTADGRTDHKNSAIFVLQDIFSPIAGNFELTSKENSEFVQAQIDFENKIKSDISTKGEILLDKVRKDSLVINSKVKWLASLDFYELTLYTYYIDALVDIFLSNNAKNESLGIVYCFDICKCFGSIFPSEDERMSIQKKIESYGHVPYTKESYGHVPLFDVGILNVVEKSVQLRDNVPGGIPSPQYLYSIFRAYDTLIKAFEKCKEGDNKYDILLKLISKHFSELKKQNNKKLPFQDEAISSSKKAVEFVEKISNQFEEKCNKNNISDGVSVKYSQKKYPKRGDLEKTFDFYRQYQDYTKPDNDNIIFRESIERLEYAFVIAVYSKIHNRLTIHRRHGTLIYENAELLKEIEQDYKDFAKQMSSRKPE